MSRSFTSLLLLGTFAAVSLTPMTRAQDIVPEPAKPAAERAARPAKTDPERPEIKRFRDQLRKHVQDRLDRGRKMMARLEKAMEMIDSGGDPAKIKELVDGPGAGEAKRKENGDGAGETGTKAARPNAAGSVGSDAKALGMVGFESEATRPLSPDEREELIALFQQHDPRIAEQLRVLQGQFEGRGAPLFERTLDSLAPRARLIREASSKGDKEMTRLRIDDVRSSLDIFRMAFAYTKARRENDPAKERKALDDLRQALGKQFDVRVQIRRREIDELQEKVKVMRAEIDKLEGNRQQIITSWTEHGPLTRGKPQTEKAEKKDKAENVKPEGN